MSPAHSRLNNQNQTDSLGLATIVPAMLRAMRQTMKESPWQQQTDACWNVVYVVCGVVVWLNSNVCDKCA